MCFFFFFFFCFVFLVREGIEDPYIAVNGPSSPRQRNAIKWRLAAGPMMAQNKMLAW